MADTPGATFLAEAQTMLHERFAIGHATIQIEQGEACATGC